MTDWLLHIILQHHVSSRRSRRQAPSLVLLMLWLHRILHVGDLPHLRYIHRFHLPYTFIGHFCTIHPSIGSNICKPTSIGGTPVVSISNWLLLFKCGNPILSARQGEKGILPRFIGVGPEFLCEKPPTPSRGGIQNLRLLMVPSTCRLTRQTIALIRNVITTDEVGHGWDKHADAVCRAKDLRTMMENIYCLIQDLFLSSPNTAALARVCDSDAETLLLGVLLCRVEQGL